MNKPIRTVSIFCLLLFLALLVNATYLQYCQRRARSTTGSATGGCATRDVLPRPRRDPGRQARRSRRASRRNDQYKYQRVYPQPFMYAPLTGWFSFGNETGGRARPELHPLRRGRPALRQPAASTSSTATPPRAATSCSPSTRPPRRRPSTASRRSGRHRRAPWSRSSPATGKILAMVSLPTYDPNKLASHDFKAANAYAAALSKSRASRCCNRAIQTTLPPGSTFKMVTARPRCRPAGTPRPPRCPAARAYRLPAVHQGPRQRDPALRHRPRSPSPRPWSSPATPPSRRSRSTSGGDAMHKTAEGFGFNQHYLATDQYPARRSRCTPAGIDDAPDGAVRLRPVRRHRHPAADGDGRRRHRQQRRRDDSPTSSTSSSRRRRTRSVPGRLRAAQPGDLGDQRRRR